MTKESTYELQLIDCNCNDCVHLVRDLSRYTLSQIFHEKLQKEEFDRNRNHELFIGYTLKETTTINKAFKLQFKPQKPITQFGYCKKLDFTQVSFIPGTCQLETQKCFEHRRSPKFLTT